MAFGGLGWNISAIFELMRYGSKCHYKTEKVNIFYIDLSAFLRDPKYNELEKC